MDIMKPLAFLFVMFVNLFCGFYLAIVVHNMDKIDVNAILVFIVFVLVNFLVGWMFSSDW